jgi:ABC-type sugar transport system ATPase subunit
MAPRVMAVDIDGLRFERQGRMVLDIAALRLTAGCTTAILGPNGAGKTTLLRLIAGLERPQHGSILRSERAFAGGGRARPDVAFVFQEQVFLRQSVRRNLELGLRLRGIASDERRARIDEAARLLGVTALLDRDAHLLSVGEGRRVGIARAICLQAPLVLLDEPLAGLDATSHARLLDDLPRLLRRMATTTVLVTHSRDEALRLGTDLVVLIEGRVRASGHKREVAGRPVDADVATALGYTVVTIEGRRLAVPPGAFAVGPGDLEFRMVVDEVLDMADQVEIVGRLAGVRIRVAAPIAAAPQSVAEPLLIHAQRAFELPG